MNFTIYLLSTGEIQRIVDCNESAIDNQYNSIIEGYIEGNYPDTMFYIENGSPQSIPPQPGPWYVFDFTTKQWQQDATLAEQSVNQQRVLLLYQSDWTQIPNNPLTSEQQQQWAIYRQELRDIPQQSGYPFNVVWPTPPQ